MKSFHHYTVRECGIFPAYFHVGGGREGGTEGMETLVFGAFNVQIC